MDLDFTPFFSRYEQLMQAADAAFVRIKAEYPDKVTCKIGCADCCYALFDLSLIEALYINHKFNAEFEKDTKQNLLNKANRADRKIYQIKRQAYKYHQAGKNEVEILSKIGAESVRCPLLNQADRCDLYAYRPITCRLYGLPISIYGISHTCGKTGFNEGESYTTVHLEKIHEQLTQISMDLVGSIRTRYAKMAEMLVPLSMALLSVYDEEYLGVKPDQAKEK